MPWLGNLMAALRFRADTVRRLERAEDRARLAENTLRDYDRRLADALVQRTELIRQYQAFKRRIRARRSPRNLSHQAMDHGQAVASR